MEERVRFSPHETGDLRVIARFGWRTRVRRLRQVLPLLAMITMAIVAGARAVTDGDLGLWDLVLVGAAVLALPALVLVPLVMSLVAGTRERRSLPGELSQPPDDTLPAHVAALTADPSDRVDRAVAATVLHLVQGGVLDLESLDAQRFLVRRGSNTRELSSSESVLMGQIGDETLRGPSMWDGRWGMFSSSSFDRMLAAEMVEAKLLGEAHRSLVATFLGIVLAVAYTQAYEVGIIGYGLAVVWWWTFLVVNAFWPYGLTSHGARTKARWLAHGRYLQHTRLDEVDPPGISVWGEHLVGAVALGVADRAMRALAPAATDRHLRYPLRSLVLIVVAVVRGLATSVREARASGSKS